MDRLPLYLSWDEILLGPPSRRCLREPDIELDYHLHKLRKTEQFGSVTNYLNVSLADPFESEIFMRNKFPYLCSPDIRHYVAWIGKDRKFTTEQILILAKERFPSCEIFAWENRPNNRSIHDIRHYQVFVRLLS